MKFATTLVIGIVLVAAATVYWAIQTFKVTGWPGFGTNAPITTPVATEAKPEPPKPVVHKAAAKPAPAPAPVVAVEAPPPAPPAPPAAVKPDLPFPTTTDVKVGAERSALLETFHEPTMRAISTDDGDLVETYVYAQPGTRKDTWVVLVNGEVAEKYNTDHTPVMAATRHTRTHRAQQ